MNIKKIAYRYSFSIIILRFFSMIIKKLLNRENIIKKIIPIAVITLFIILLYDISNYIYSDRVLSSYENKYKIMLPDGWRENRNLNSDASLQLSDEQHKNYIVVIAESKQDIIKKLNLNQYTSAVQFNMYRNIDNVKIINSNNIKINDCNGIEFQATGEINKVKIRYIYMIIETKDNFQQIIGWTLDSDYINNRGKLLNIMRSFKEDENKLNINESI